MNLKQAWRLMKEAVSAWSNDYAPSMGAALSYYTLFSIAPLLLIVIAVAGLVFGADAVQGTIMAQLEGLMGENGAEAIEEMLSSASTPEKGGIATVIGIGGLLLGATTVFNELQSDLDRIWRAPAREKSSGIFKLLRTRILSFGLILALAFVTMISLVLTAALAALGKWWGSIFGGWEILAHVVDLAVSFGLLTTMFALIYKLMPRVHIQWRDVWVGAGVTAALFTIGKFLIGLYLGKSDIASSFGAAGSFAIVMLWVYYSTQIFLLGAEFTWVYAHEYGSRRGEAREGAPSTEAKAGKAEDASNGAAPEGHAVPAAASVAASTAIPDLPAANAETYPLPAASGTSLAGRAQEALHRKPLLAVGLAAGAGLAIAALTRNLKILRHVPRRTLWSRWRRKIA